MSNAGEHARILVVDDAKPTLEVLQRNLASAGYAVFTAGGVAEAVEVLNKADIDLVITDLKMPKISGLDLVRHVRENLPDTEVMMITGYASIEGAVEAVKSGADEYLAKPFTDEELFSAVRRSLDKLANRRAVRSATTAGPANMPGFIGRSEAMQAVFRLIPKAAATNATVLITGESGTGKELIARAIHYNSPRAAAPFVPVNCGGIPETLLESELFGHLKGAFTGASESRAGFFQTAEGGTIFLDEVSETSLGMQVKLLRVLQDKEVCMVGATRGRKVDVRIMAATNRDLRELVRKSAFREDLFFRLNVINIVAPPLRDRADDIPALLRHFAAKYARDAGKPPPQFTDRAVEALRGYAWPGNVRELENVVQQLVVMCEGNEIDARDLPALMRFSVHAGSNLHRSLAQVEADHIRDVLISVGGNRTQAAKILGIDRKTLRQKLKTYELEPQE
ncbi:MAG: sigma-54-dependent Fis family transcriptional regulator [Phycisphaerae bacterium]|jgi:DNA-binding NtrC family response regulator